MVQIDGAQQLGSGTIVRYAVAMAALLDQPLYLVNARARREGFRIHRTRSNSTTQRYELLRGVGGILLLLN